MAKKPGELKAPLPGTRSKDQERGSPIKTGRMSVGGGGLRSLTVRVDSDLYRTIRQRAVDTDQSHQEIMETAIRQYLDAPKT